MISSKKTGDRISGKGKMKRGDWVWILIFCLMGLFPRVCSAIEVTSLTGINYDCWEDNKHNKGRQFYIPISAEVRYQDFSLRLLTGYALTYFDPSPGDRQSLSHLLDTKINLSYELIGKLPVDLLFGLDFNLPTGKADLGLKKRGRLFADPDLVSIRNFGEGFNINPTINLAKEWKDFVFGLGAGYVWRGEYDSKSKFLEINDEVSADILTYYAKDYDPGEMLILNGEVQYHLSSSFYSRLFSTYVWYGKDRINDKKFYQEGDFFLLGLGFLYSQEKWESNLTLKGIFRGKSQFKADLGDVSSIPESEWFARALAQPLITEERNSHGDEWIADLSVKYILDNKTSIKSFFQALFISKNDYPSFSPYYLGRREKYTLGFGATRNLLSFLEGEIYVKGFIMHDGERKYPDLFQNQTISERHYRGFSTEFMFTSRF